MGRLRCLYPGVHLQARWPLQKGAGGDHVLSLLRALLCPGELVGNLDAVTPSDLRALLSHAAHLNSPISPSCPLHSFHCCCASKTLSVETRFLQAETHGLTLENQV